MNALKLILVMMAAIVLAGCEERPPYVSPQAINVKVLSHAPDQWGVISTKTDWTTIVQDEDGNTYKMRTKIGERGDILRVWRVNNVGSPARVGDKIYLSLDNPF